MKNMKNTWAGIYLQINRTKRTKKNSNHWSDPLTDVINILMIPRKFQMFLTCIFLLLDANWHPKYHLLLVILRSIYPVITASLSFLIQWLPSKLKRKHFPFLWIKHTDYTLASCPTRILSSAKHIMNMQNDTSRFQTSRSQITEYMF